MKKILFLCLVCLVALFNGCKKKTIQQDSTFQRAERAMAEGQYEMARLAYIECLDKAPTESIVHRRLADIYYDHLDRMEYAIYHYEQSVRLNPQQDDAVNMQHWITGARKKLMKDLINLYMPQEIDAKRRMEEKLLTLENDNAQLKRRIELLTRTRMSTRTPPQPASNEEVEPRRSTEVVNVNPPPTRTGETPMRPTPRPTQTQELPQPTAPVARTVPPRINEDKFHTVVRGETLSSIALRYYKDKRKFILIIRANPDKFQNTNTPLRVGMVLKIPNPTYP